MRIALLDKVYSRLQTGVNFCYSLANTIFQRQEANKNLIERTNSVVKNLSHQIQDISVHTNQILYQIESLNNRITQIDKAQIYLQEELENVSRHRDAESITKCRNYIKKICNTLNTIKIALSKISRLHEDSSSCNICIMHLNTYKDNLIQVQKYLQLAIPYLYSFRDLEKRRQLLHLFKNNNLEKGIIILSTPIETDEPNSCSKIEKILGSFKKVFPIFYDEIMEIRSTFEESITDEQVRRPSLRILDVL